MPDALDPTPPCPVRCAWCGRVRDAEGTWGPPPQPEPAPLIYSHGICQGCLADVKLSEGLADD